MAQYRIRINLTAASWPFISQLWGRSVIVPQYDENYNFRTASSESDDKDIGIPQVFYLHNCMPTPQGFQSVGYVEVTPAFGSGTNTDFDQAFLIIPPSEQRYLFVPAGGANYILDGSVGTWMQVSPLAPGAVDYNVQVTTAYVNGQTYIYYSKNGCYIFNDTANPQTITLQTLAGLTATDVKGICEANGYMIAWDDTNVSWSNLSNPVDFVPNILTGAGGGQIQDAKGKIQFCKTVSGGFLVYCEQNIVSARYSGNVNFPFIFAEVPGSGGGALTTQVSWQSNLAEQFVWNIAGLQQVDKVSSKAQFPEVTDFLSGKLFEDFDETVLQFTVSTLQTPVDVKLAVISERYLVISYGVVRGIYTHALCYDLYLKRWGKFKITHAACFEWNNPNITGTITYGQLKNVTYGQLAPATYGDLNVGLSMLPTTRTNLAFLQQDGTVKVVDFSLTEIDADGVLLLGKFQLQRAAWMQHLNSDVETVYGGNTFNYYIFPSYDGKTLLPAVNCFPIINNNLLRRYGTKISGLNLSAMLVGSFNATTAVITFGMGGNR